MKSSWSLIATRPAYVNQLLFFGEALDIFPQELHFGWKNKLDVNDRIELTGFRHRVITVGIIVIIIIAIIIIVFRKQASSPSSFS